MFVNTSCFFFSEIKLLFYLYALKCLCIEYKLHYINHKKKNTIKGFNIDFHLCELNIRLKKVIRDSEQLTSLKGKEYSIDTSEVGIDRIFIKNKLQYYLTKNKATKSIVIKHKIACHYPRHSISR